MHDAVQKRFISTLLPTTGITMVTFGSTMVIVKKISVTGNRFFTTPKKIWLPVTDIFTNILTMVGRLVTLFTNLIYR